MKWFFMGALIFGSLAFVLDAFFAHGLKNYLGEHYSDAAHNALTTASRYQFYASIMILVLMLWYRNIPSIFIIISACLCVLGVVFFCGTIYLKYLFAMGQISGLAPMGGICFMSAFIALLPLFFFL